MKDGNCMKWTAHHGSRLQGRYLKTIIYTMYANIQWNNLLKYTVDFKFYLLLSVLVVGSINLCWIEKLGMSQTWVLNGWDWCRDMHCLKG